MTRDLPTPAWTVAALVAAVLPLAAAGAASGSAAPGLPDSLTIIDCARLAATGAPDVRGAALDLEAARADSAAAAHNRRPTFSLFGSVLVAPRGFYDPTVTDLGHYDLRAGLVLPLFDGGDAARERSRATNDAGLAALEQSRAAREAALRAAGLAIEIVRLRELAATEQGARLWLDDLAGLLAARLRAGAGGPSDTMRVALERDAVAATVETARTAQAAAVRALAQMLGLAPAELPPVRAPRPDEAQAPAAADSARLAAGVVRLPEVRSSKLAGAQARVDLAAAEQRKGWRGDLAADAGISGADLTRVVPPDLRESDPDANLLDRLRRDLGASVTFEVRRPLVDPTLAPAVAARQVRVRAADLRAGTVTDTQQRGAADLFDRWRAAAHRVATARATVARAETSLLRVKSLYMGGAVGLLDLLDARRVLADARERLADAQADLRLARIEAEIRP